MLATEHKMVLVILLAAESAFISSERNSAHSFMLSLGQPKYHVNQNDEWMLLHAVYVTCISNFVRVSSIQNSENR
jgi:hypothetical protein